ncbi:MAG: 5-formyltetrahydrofolate cyclo-ligase [Bdellovibrionales bacterium RBG_16_40_8]|nr:MAG: 5-formyltetrahydrofolate cyclo-ligase [Bdellovibrionales bacterium RBG_16_40_8]
MTDSEIIEKKSAIRRRIQASLAHELPDSEVSERIISFLKKILPTGVIIGAFKSRPDEPDLEALYADKNYQFAFSRIESSALEFYIPQVSHAFGLNSFGIPEPIQDRSKKIILEAMKAILVPGIAFDRNGVRLGRGEGFYDRTLVHFTGLKIGIGMVGQMTNDDLPRASHDVVMDMVVTDKFIYRRFDS